MEDLFLHAYRDLKERLKAAEAAGSLPADTAERCMNAVIYYISELKQRLDFASLRDAAVQIPFYKEMFPAFFSEVIYYRKLLEIESSVQGLSQTVVNAYFKAHLEKISRYLEKRLFLQRYILSNRKHLDDLLFTQNVNLPIYPDTGEYHDADYFNFSSFLISKIRAYGRAHFYLSRRLALPDEKNIFHTADGPLPEINIDTEAFKTEKADIDKKLSWLEKETDERAKKMYQSLFNQRSENRKARNNYTEHLLQQLKSTR